MFTLPQGDSETPVLAPPPTVQPISPPTSALGITDAEKLGSSASGAPRATLPMVHAYRPEPEIGVPVGPADQTSDDAPVADAGSSASPLEGNDAGAPTAATRDDDDGEGSIAAAADGGHAGVAGKMTKDATGDARPAPAAGTRAARSRPFASDALARPASTTAFDQRWIWGGGAAAVGLAAFLLFGGGSDDADVAAGKDDAGEVAANEPVASTPQETPPAVEAPVAAAGVAEAEEDAAAAQPDQAQPPEQMQPPEQAPTEAEAPIPEASPPAQASAPAADDSPGAAVEKPAGPPAGLPDLKPVRGTGEAADLLGQAQAALEAGDAGKAYSLAEQSYGLRRRNDTVKVMAIAGCVQGDGLAARAAYRKLVGGSERNEVQDFCKGRGVEVLSSVPGHTADELLTQAEIAAEEGRHGEAYRLAKRSNRKRHSAKTLQIMGVEACKWKRPEKVVVVLGMLRPDMRIPVERACEDAGVELPQ